MSDVRYLGNDLGDSYLFDGVAALWEGSIDGSNLRLLLQNPPTPSGFPLYVYPVPVADGRVAHGCTDQVGLCILGADGVDRFLIDWGGFPMAPSADGSVIYVSRYSQHPFRDLGIWRVPLDGSPPSQALPLSRGILAVSADGRSVATAMPPGNMGELPLSEKITVSFDGGPSQFIDWGFPIGFDTKGRLISGNRSPIHRYDPATGRSRDLISEYGRGVIVGGGRWLVALTDDPPVIKVIDLESLELVHKWTYPHDPYGAEFTLLGDDRYAVLAVYLGGMWDPGPATHLIIDPVEGWLGWVQFVPQKVGE